MSKEKTKTIQLHKIDVLKKLITYLFFWVVSVLLFDYLLSPTHATLNLSSIYSIKPEYKANKKLIVSAGDLKENKNKLWKREICKRVHALANQVISEGVTVSCREFDTSDFTDSELKNLLRENDYHLRIMRTKDDSLSVDVTNLKRKSQADFETLGWHFRNTVDGRVKKEDAFTKAIANLFLYVGNEEKFKKLVLAAGSVESNKLTFDEKSNLLRDKILGTPLSIDDAMKVFESEGERKKNYLRTAIEVGVALSAGAVGYLVTWKENSVDFDYGFAEGLKKKIITGEAINFDENIKFNNIGHAFAGAIYYGAARSNGFNSLESLLVTFVSSAAWEFFEYQEAFSINDQIFTPLGGYVIGEASYQMTCALLAKDSTFAKAIGYLTNPAIAANHLLDSRSRKQDKFAGQPDCKKPRWSEISLYVGLDNGQKPYETKSNSDLFFGINSKVINIGEYGKNGKEAKLIYDTAMTEAIIEGGTNDGLLDLKVIAKTVMAAYYKKNIKSDENGEIQGYDFLIGVGSAATWNDRGGKEFSKDEDFYGTVNILGLNAHADVYYKGVNFRVDFGIYGDFAMVKSYALNNYKQHMNGDLSQENGNISGKGYYWGYGLTSLAAISLSKGRVRVGYEGQFSASESINSGNRTQGSNPSTFRDSYMMNKFYVNFSIAKNLTFQVSREYYSRSGTVNGSFGASGTETRTMGSLIYYF